MLLTLLGALAKELNVSHVAPRLLGGVTLFALGVFAATLSAGFSTLQFALLWRALPGTDDVHERTVRLIISSSTDATAFPRKRLFGVLARLCFWAAVLSALISAGLFVQGAYKSGSAFIDAARVARPQSDLFQKTSGLKAEILVREANVDAVIEEFTGGPPNP